MTKRRRLYEILGLEAEGRARPNIRKAPAALMQRLHPDVGGSPLFFAVPASTRAKDVLAVRSTITLLRLTYLPGGIGRRIKAPPRSNPFLFLFQRVARIPGLGARLEAAETAPYIARAVAGKGFGEA